MPRQKNYSWSCPSLMLLTWLQFFCLQATWELILATDAGDVVAPSCSAPYQVSIMSVNKKQHYCSGGIIGNHWIVTAAQCVRYIDVYQTEIVTGLHDIQNIKEANFYHIDFVITHANFDKPPGFNDIALIRSNSKILFGKCVQPIELSSGLVPSNIRATLTGWNWRQAKHPDSSKLRSISVLTLSYSRCEKNVTHPLDVGHLCLKIPIDSTYCNTELGSPIVYKNRLLGISSLGPNCSNGQPYVASSITFFHDFIRTKMKGCARCLELEGFSVAFFP